MKKKSSVEHFFQKMRFLSLVWLFATGIALSQAQDCINMWDADPHDITLNICPVVTTEMEQCEFPFNLMVKIIIIVFYMLKFLNVKLR